MSSARGVRPTASSAPAIASCSGTPLRIHTHPPPEVEIFARGEIEVESDRLRHDPDKRARRRTGVDTDAIDSYFARVAREDSGDHRDRGGLAGAVGPEQTIDFTSGDGEADTIDRDSRSEALAEPAHEQRGPGLLRHHLCRSMFSSPLPLSSREVLLTRSARRATNTRNQHPRRGFVLSSANFPDSRTRQGSRPSAQGERDTPPASAPFDQPPLSFRDRTGCTRLRACR